LSVPEALLPWAQSTLGRAGDDQASIERLAGDASSRRYYRAHIAGNDYVLADAPPATEKNAAFLAVRDLLEGAGVRVPALHGADLERGYLLLEDLGDRTLLPALTDDTAAGYYRDAFAILLRLAAVDVDAASLPPYDGPVLSEELRRFPDWFVGELLGHALSPAEHGLLDALFTLLVDSALAQPRVLVHRDFHSRNLMLVDGGALAVSDFQDAVAGPLTYDLVSLLRDCYVRWPADRVVTWALDYRELLLERGRDDVGDAPAFLRAFDRMGLQRHIKVLGTFARLCLRDGKRGYLADLPRVIGYCREILEKYAGEEPVFAEFLRWYDDCLAPRVAATDWGCPR